MRWYEADRKRKGNAALRWFVRLLSTLGFTALFLFGISIGCRFRDDLQAAALGMPLESPVSRIAAVFFPAPVEEAEPEPEPEPDPYARPLPILMYHDVVPDGTPCNDMRVTVSKLRSDFHYLARNGYTPVLPRELLYSEDLPEKPVLITFDDGYASMYNLVFPILKEYGFRAVVSPIVGMPDVAASSFCTWMALREMASSGLVEVGSHSYHLHNLDNSGMVRPKDQPNGIQRLPGESDGDFQTRVLDDIRLSRDRITAEIGIPPVFFAYPFGAEEPDAQALIDDLFPVSVLTQQDTADMSKGLVRMPRWTVLMEENIVENLAG